jgi:hypothetical protein
LNRILRFQLPNYWKNRYILRKNPLKSIMVFKGTPFCNQRDAPSQLVVMVVNATLAKMSRLRPPIDWPDVEQNHVTQGINGVGVGGTATQF